MQRSRVPCRAAAVSVLGLLWVVTAAFTCPERCYCRSDEEVYCTGRGLTEVPANIPMGTTVLRLAHNNIQNLSDADFSYLTSLELLDLSFNEIRVIPAGVFSHLTSLRSLNLSGNHIADLPDGVFSRLTSLWWLYLSDNHIADLPDGVFSRLTSLKWLRLSDNHIADLPDGVFSNLTSLEQLHLHNNNISSLPTGVFAHLTSLQYLYIAGNPWSCDCKLYGPLTSAGLVDLIKDTPTCSSPPHMEADTLSSVTADKVCLGRGDCNTGSADGTCACNVRWTGPFCETEHNLALGKKASQSSTRAFNGVSAGAEKAVDGSVTDCAVTNPEQQPWWKVDLAGYYRVSRVRVINRLDVDTAAPTSAPGCGGILTVPPGGTVTSPNYPNDYGNDENCGWLITVPEGSRVLLTFDRFELEDDFDYLTIYDGGSSSAPRLQRLTGNAIPDPVTSTSNQVFVRFTSDDSDTAQGFQFSYTATGDTLMVRVGPNEDFTQNDQCGQTYDVGSALEFPNIEADCDPPMYGRYVSVQAAPPVGVNTTGLALCEVEVYATDICCDYTISSVLNGKITATDGYCSGNDIQFSCDPGYAPRPGATCQNNGSWDGEIPTCQRICCNKTISIMNGQITADSGFCSGSSIQFSCDTGYELVGSSFAVCGDKQWDREIPTCRRICCDNTTEIMHGLVNATDGYCFGNEIQFSCNPGYELVGRSSATCEDNVSWGRELPTCRLPSEQSQLHMSTGATIGVIFGAVIGISIAIATMLKVGSLFVRRRQKRKRRKVVEDELERLMSNGERTSEGSHLVYDVFISYSSKDADWVRDSLVADLESNGYIVCLDERDFVGGESVIANIVKSIYQSRKVILVMSKNFIKSGWCIYEMTLAWRRKLDLRENCVVVIKYDDCKILRSLALRTYLEWTKQTDKDTFWDKLHEALGPVETLLQV